MSDGEQNKKRKLEEIADAGGAAPAPPQETGAAEEQDAPATHSNSSSIISSSSPMHDEHGQLAKEKESIMKLLEPFSREQLVEILTSAASQYDNIYNEIKTVASADVAHRKVFVRGLAWETSTETLKSAFASFGEVEEGAVIFDKASGKSRGYGFVTFVDMEAAQRAVEKQVVEIDSYLQSGGPPPALG
uniref:RRM domain-containing protein n=1 Tax=Globisporangium ultimum (strain ATCC 200006 / CBS 805.95 / DAOM BR144) TaxID=431595 RepID=K3W6L1_GLOUD